MRFLAVLLLLASCGGPPAAPDRSFMGITRTRCAQGDAGACRILQAASPG